MHLDVWAWSRVRVNFVYTPANVLVESDSESSEGRRARFLFVELPFFITFFYAKAEHFVLF